MDRLAGAGLVLAFVHPLLRGCWDLWSQTLVHGAAAALAGALSWELFAAKRDGVPIPLSSARRSAPALLMPLAWVCASAWSAWTSPFPRSAEPAFLNDVNAVIFFWLFLFFLEGQGGFRRQCEKAFAGPLVVYSLAALLLYWRDPLRTGLFDIMTAHFSSSDRAFLNPNVLAAYHVLGFPILWKTAWVDAPASRYERWFWRGGFGASLLCLFMTRSVAGLGLVAAEVCALWWLKSPPPRFSRRAVLAAAASLIVLGGIAGGAALRLRWAEASQVQRFEWMRAGVEMFLNRPLWGGGPGSFGEAYPGFHSGALTVENTLFAHNIVAETLGERGALGFLSFFSFSLWVLFRSLRGGGPDSHAPALGAAGFLAFNLFHFGSSVPSLMWLYWTALALAFRSPASPPAALPAWGAPVLLAACLPWLTVPAATLFRADQHLARARQAAMEGEWEAAEVGARKSLEWNSDSPEAFSLLAAAAFRRRDWTAAEVAAASAIRLSPTTARFHAELGYCLLAQERKREAMSALEESAKLNPLDSEVWLQVGELRRASGDVEKARTAFENIVTLNENLYPRMHSPNPERRREIFERARLSLEALGPAG